MVDYTNSQISSLIDEHIHHALHRKTLKDRLIDGVTYEQIYAGVIKKLKA